MPANNTPNKKVVEIEANGDTLKFQVGLLEFNNFQNDFLPNSKVAPSVNFLNVCIDDTQKEALNELCDQGFAVDLAQMVASEFKPDIQLRIKK